MNYHKNDTFGAILGESILYASFQFALASVEMSSRFSVLNFAKDQQTLQNGCNALTSYLTVGTIFTVGAVLVLYAKFGIQGALICALMNALVLAWIAVSYRGAFRRAAQTHGLEEPEMFISMW